MTISYCTTDSELCRRTTKVTDVEISVAPNIKSTLINWMMPCTLYCTWWQSYRPDQKMYVKTNLEYSLGNCAVSGLCFVNSVLHFANTVLRSIRCHRFKEEHMRWVPVPMLSTICSEIALTFSATLRANFQTGLKAFNGVETATCLVPFSCCLPFILYSISYKKVRVHFLMPVKLAGLCFSSINNSDNTKKTHIPLHSTAKY